MRSGCDPIPHVLAEFQTLLIGGWDEYACLVDKRTGSTRQLGDFYGGPTCALIIDDEEWCLVGGEHVLPVTRAAVTVVGGIKWVHAMRSSRPARAKLLTDPWGDDPSVWELDVEARALHRLDDFPEYKDRPYTDTILW
ncbi:MAG: hypothetical protein LUE17_06145 [Planctomycetaceae bacterium]|nr:hypothetical protein [Planctomycetaceae bacterium]